MKILLLSAYDAQSHCYWRTQLVAHFPEHDWTVLTLPPRYFSWRVRGNSLSWAYGERACLEQNYDLVVATSMCDVTGLKGLVPNLARLPWLVYFHENQFAYPRSGREFASVEPQLLNLYNALAADTLLFNSDFNRQSLLEGAATLCRRLPDHVPADVIALIEQKAQVLPVPLADELFVDSSARALSDTPNNAPLKLLWNHRWEFDKGPELLLAALQQLDSLCRQQGLAFGFELHIVGQQFRQTPEAFAQIKQQFAPYIASWGYVEDGQAYRKVVQQADVVLSTALHDYQGIAVLEAVAAGAMPLVPDRLAYPELFDQQFRYRSGEGESHALAAALLDLYQRSMVGEPLPQVDVNGLRWSNLRECYQRALEGKPLG
ncbi:tRNA-queuosine alpha-mannosyltransferase domain-containing protein [Aliagarivorans marinus]|uniref:tRNA-queuosine alpha-mannosyltransferase domain-containing protein n=1 Tax=Aliagarivorans marinus TaxID=561965 RepID=UPI000420E72D|nr:DUF3524 domain-containing protein [Aliagarivorans marinus]